MFKCVSNSQITRESIIKSITLFLKHSVVISEQFVVIPLLLKYLAVIIAQFVAIRVEFG